MFIMFIKAKTLSVDSDEYLNTSIGNETRLLLLIVIPDAAVFF